MARGDKATRQSQCSLCHFFYTSKERHNENGRKCRVIGRFVQPTDPVCSCFFLYSTQWCPKKEQLIPVGSCIRKQELMRRQVGEKRWYWRRCINCVQGVLLFKLVELTNENRLRLLGRTGGTENVS